MTFAFVVLTIKFDSLLDLNAFLTNLGLITGVIFDLDEGKQLLQGLFIDLHIFFKNANRTISPLAAPQVHRDNIPFNLAISASKAKIRKVAGSTLTRARFVTFFALSANLRVLTVSSYAAAIGVKQAITTVKELPPSESLRRYVSFESLYGICEAFVDRLLITFPRLERDWLMAEPSFNLAPVAPVESARSEPNRIVNLLAKLHF